MDPLLTRRYEALFRAYGTGCHPIVLDAKNRITAALDNTPPLLRIDGAHFLLVNTEHMVFRALGGYIPDPDGRPIDQRPSDSDPRRPVMECLEIILDDLSRPDVEKPASAHAVLLSVHLKWSQIGAKLTWA